MKKRFKIVGFILLLLLAGVVLIRFQAKQILISLIESNSDNKIQVNIGQINIQPYNSTIRLEDVFVEVKDEDSESYIRTTLPKVFLDVASLWDFYAGGTLIIEKFECEGGELTIHNQAGIDTARHAFNLNAIIQRIKSDAIRFRIKDIVFRDFNLVLSKEGSNKPTTIKHLQARAQDLYLSADSIRNKGATVEFSLPGQTITLPSQLALSFDSLFFSTTDNSIQLNNLDLSSPSNELVTIYRVRSDKVRLAHFNFESLYTEGKLVIDSIYLGRSDIKLDWTVDTSTKEKKNESGILALPAIDIHNVLFSEVASDIIIRSDSLVNTYQVENASLLVDNFKHRPDSSHIISSPFYNLIVTKYATFLERNQSTISFDTIQIQKHSLSLLNFAFKPKNQKQPLIQSPRFELKGVNWYEFLVNQKLVTEEALAYNPTIITTIKRNTNNEHKSANYLAIIDSLNNYLQLSKFTLINATSFVKIADKSIDITLHGYNTSIMINQLFNSATVAEGIKAIKELSFKSLRIESPEYHGQLDNFRFSDNKSSLRSLRYQAGDNIVVTLAGVNVGAIDWNEANNTLSLNGLSWQTLAAAINSEKNTQSENSKSGTIPAIHIKNIRGGNTDVLFNKQDLNIHTELLQINLDGLLLADGIQLEGIDIKGNSMAIDSKPNKIAMGPFYVTDQLGAIHDVQLKRYDKDSIDVNIAKLMFEAKLPDFAQQKYLLSKLEVNDINTRFTRRDSIQSFSVALKSSLSARDIKYDEKNISVASLNFDSGPINLVSEKWTRKESDSETVKKKSGTRKLRNSMDTLMQKRYVVKEVQKPNQGIIAFHSSSYDTATYYKKIFKLHSLLGGVKLKFNQLETSGLDSSAHFKANLNSLQLDAIDISTDKISVLITNGSLNDLVLNSDHLKDPWELLEDNHPTAAIHNLKAKIETNGNQIRFDQLDYNPQISSGTIRQFEFWPLKDKQQFLADSYYQTNYMHAKIESIVFHTLDIKRMMNDSVFHLSKIQVTSPNLEIGRDKTHPFFAAAVKPLPTNAFQQVGVKFKIDSVLVSYGKIAYTEKSRITEKEGTINFTKMNALVRNVKNVDLESYDSLRIRASALFMDSARVNLRMRESYADTLGGFVLTTQVGPFKTSILNTALVPMVAVDFKSGFVDTLYMRAIGREYLSLGSMKFLYHDLKVEFLDRNDTSRHSLRNQLLKFAANTFVVRTNNSDRTGKVYYERDRNRAVFQYWVKMILSGVTTSVGAKSNKRQIKKYMKELNQKKLPAIEDDFVL